VLQKASEEDRLVTAALNTHGTRAVQKLIETLATREQVCTILCKTSLCMTLQGIIILCMTNMWINPLGSTHAADVQPVAALHCYLDWNALSFMHAGAW